jgi:hypothetical protein
MIGQMAQVKDKPIDKLGGDYSFSRRGGAVIETVQIVPIRSRRNGRIVRYVVHSKNPTREKGDVG